ncbi:hypothetical protein ABZT17_12125 [Streptomyces sp. NPDC005648]|uniref:hypothetical protein n=1 Tax=Streptomyces sp. NPDC005648 TaxID=3157044 RepID=UPI0033AA85E4
MAETPTVTLRDLADAWHACAVLGLLSPAAAAVTDSVGALLAAAALLQGHGRPAATLTLTTAASLLAGALIHRGGAL